MAATVKAITSGVSKSVGGFREITQDLVAPELRAVKTSIESLTQELRLRSEALSHEMKLRNDSLLENLSKEIHLRTESLKEELRLRDSVQSANIQRLENSQTSLTDAVKDLARKIDGMNLDLRERVAALEARAPRQ
jgi:hypothetical protein